MAYSASYARHRAEIEDLVARYLFAMDWNDFDAYAERTAESHVEAEDDAVADAVLASARRGRP